MLPEAEKGERVIQLVLGGARSGKSRHAERIAKSLEAKGFEVLYIATAQCALPDEETSNDSVAYDPEMAERIARHQSDRPANWRTIESSVALAEALQENDNDKCCFLVDCLTLWTLNVLEQDCLQQQKKALIACLPRLQAEVVLVSNEVGLGVIPIGQLTRQFVDELGWLHQDIAAVADKVTFVTAGLPMVLKPADGDKE